MAEVKKIATRDAYGKALVELGRDHDDLLVFDADLAEATRSGKFGEAYPERFIDCGIAEANMIGMAAGVAATGPVGVTSAHPVNWYPGVASTIGTFVIGLFLRIFSV